MTYHSFGGAWFSFPAGKLWAFAGLSLLFAALGRIVRGVTTSGALAGAVICLALLVGAGLGGFVTLLTVFLLTWGTTRIGYARKQSLGTAEANAGRDASQVFANLGVAALCAMLHVTLRDQRLLIAMGAVLSEAAADTVSSEIGQAVGIVGLTCAFFGIFAWHDLPICVGAGVVGTLVDSLLGATLERRQILGNNGVNFVSTAVASLMPLLLS